MADEVDITAERMLKEEQERERARSINPYKLPEGIEGECELCDEHSPRLVLTHGFMACARCRDKHWPER